MLISTVTLQRSSTAGLWNGCNVSATTAKIDSQRWEDLSRKSFLWSILGVEIVAELSVHAEQDVVKEKGITRVSSKDLHKLEDLTDWDALRAMTDEDIECAAASDPDAPLMTDEEWANARVVWPEGKEPISIFVDSDIVQWFGNRGIDYRSENQCRLTRICRGAAALPKAFLKIRGSTDQEASAQGSEARRC